MQYSLTKNTAMTRPNKTNDKVIKQHKSNNCDEEAL